MINFIERHKERRQQLEEQREKKQKDALFIKRVFEVGQEITKVEKDVQDNERFLAALKG